MNRLRTLLVLLLCLSLPGWAVAGQWRDLGCPHHGVGAQQPHHHAGCEEHGGAVKAQCQCSHACAGGMAVVPFDGGAAMAWPGQRTAFSAGRYAGLTAQADPGFPFRPPIAAPAGAA